MKDRMRSCDVWHADTPSRVVVQKAGFTRDGLPTVKSVCLECMRMRVASRRRKAPYPNLLPRLDWAPPDLTT